MLLLRAADAVELAQVVDADGDVGHEVTSKSSVDFIVRAKINQHNGVFASLRIRRKQEDDPAVVFHRTCPQSIKTPLELVCFELRLKRVSNKLVEGIKYPFL